MHRRASVVRLAGEFGNAGTIDLLDGLLRRSHCRRVREAAVDAAMRLRDTSIGERTRIIERALRDSSELVRRRAEIVNVGIFVNTHAFVEGQTAAAGGAVEQTS